MLVNTQYFREAAIHFQKHGCYTKAPYKSKDYFDFWYEEERRCREGYKVGDLSISGRYYHYLNYMPIELNPGGDSLSTKNFEISLPDFRQIDLDWYNAVERALQEGKHLVCIKTRRAGWSYKTAHLGTYNYNFIRNSKSIFTAADQRFLIQDGILSKAWLSLDWHNQHTQNFWYRNRQFKDTILHKRASYKESGSNVERGYRSEIMGVVVNDPNKIRGKAGNLIVFEEAGSYKNLLQAWQIAYGSVTQGKYTRGLMIALGTGGEEGPSLQGLEELYYNPQTHGVLTFDNIYDTGKDKVGFFVPAYKVTDGYFDENGNCDEENAKLYYEKERLVKAANKDPKALDRYIAEFPFTPEEAFQRISTNPFPVKDLMLQRNRVKDDTSLISSFLHGRMFRNESGEVTFKLTTDKPFLDYPIKPGAPGIDGCITVYQTPYKDPKTKLVPDNLYFIVTDPVIKDREDKMTSDSVFATYVIKRPNNVDLRTDNIIVASYIGRPRTREEYYHQLFMLAEYYNGIIQCEAGGGGDGVFDYAKRTKNLHRLAYDVIFDNKKEIVSEKNRSYLLVMNKERKNEGIRYLAQWLIEPRGVSINNDYIYNYNKIYDLGLLEELIRYQDDSNFDRVSAMIIAMFMMKEYSNVQISTTKSNPNDFFNRKLFTDLEQSPYNTKITSLTY